MNSRETIRQYLAENFLFSSNGYNLGDDASLLDAGIVDSTGVVELVLFVEDQFHIEVDDNDIVPDNFDSVDNLVAYVGSKTS